MPGFWYLLPDVDQSIVSGGRLDAAVLRRFGLADVLGDQVAVPDDIVVTGTTVRRTDWPADVSGLVLHVKSAAGDDPTDWSYNASQQIWQPSSTGPRPVSPNTLDPVSPNTLDPVSSNSLGPGAQATAFIGYQRDAPPCPEDLQRSRVYGGALIADRLGQDWRVPIARSPRGHGSLPADLVRTADGVERVIDPRYQDLWELSGQVRDWIYGEYTPDEVDAWKYDAAVRILQTNYRVGPNELNLLQSLGRGVVTTETIDPILVAFVDWDLPTELLAALEKKTGNPTAD